MSAAKGGLIEIVQILSKNESRIQSNNGYTALMLAVLYEKSKCVELLTSEAGILNNENECALMISKKIKNSKAEILLCNNKLE